MIVGDRLLRSVLVLFSIYVFLFSVFSNIAPVWTTKVVADQPCMTMYTGQFLRQLQGASNCCLNNTAWRAACTAGVALRRPTHRGCRGGVRKQRLTHVKQFGVNNANLIPVLIEKVALTCKDDGLRVCCINAQSCRNKTLAIADHIIEQNIDVMAICETWLKSKRDTNVIKYMLPNGYSLEHTPRPTGKGGGVAIIYRSSLQLRKETTDTFRSFEHVACRLKTSELTVRVVVAKSSLVVVYRPPPSAKNGLTTAMFFNEWGRFIDSQTLTSGPLIVMGDLNFHVDDASNVDASRFSESVNSVGMVMHVRGPTHKKGHTLDIVLTRSADEHLIRNVTVADMGLSDHYAVSYILNICQQHTGMTNIKYRNFRTVNAVSFRKDIPLFRSEDLAPLSVDQFVDMYDDALTCLVDKHAPVKERSVRLRQDTAWYNEDLRNEKRVKRQKERAWRKSKLEVHRQIYVDQCKRVNNLLTKTKADY